MKIIAIGSVVTVILLIAILTYKLEHRVSRWERTIEEHKRVADSLQTQIDNIIINVQRKDSLLLGYMSSLDKTLDAVKKEAIKNGIAFKENLATQDSIRQKYCEEMAKLGSDFTPSNCK
jgi:hypothetical protein